MSDLFLGSAICSISARGGITLPSAFHATILARRTQDQLYVALHQDAPCLMVFDRLTAADRHERMTEDQARTGGDLDRYDNHLRRVFGCAATTCLDRRGQVVIAPWLHEQRGERSRALAVGKGDHFELWDLDLVFEYGSSVLVMLAQLHLRRSNKKGSSHDATLLAFKPSAGAQPCREPGVRVQPVPVLPMRPDPVAGLC